jgi:hypothetical protein
VHGLDVDADLVLLAEGAVLGAGLLRVGLSTWLNWPGANPFSS